MRIILSIFLIIVFYSSCYTGDEFNSRKWKLFSEDDYKTEIREEMVTSLISKDFILNKSTFEIEDVLGPYDLSFARDTTIYYVIRQHYSTKEYPDYTDFLVVKFDERKLSSRVFVERLK